MTGAKYERGDTVRFHISHSNPKYNGAHTGTVEIVDRYGTFDQCEDPSYDILVGGEHGLLYKHVRQSKVLGKEPVVEFQKEEEAEHSEME
jgi:hypothetical protein